MADVSTSVLLLESNPEIARQVNDALCEAGALSGAPYQITAVTGIEEVKAHLAGATAEVALCNPQAFPALHQFFPLLPVIVVTQADDDPAALTALQSGAADCLNISRLDGHLLSRVIRYAVERRATETALLASEGRFHALLENSVEGIALINIGGIIIYNTPAYEQILGYGRGELLGRSAIEISHPDDLAFVTEQLTKLVQSPGLRVPAAVRQQHRDGSWRWLEGVATSLLNDPNVGAIVTNFRDITDRKLAEEQLQYQAAIAEDLSEAVITTDANSIIKSWNKAAEQLHGYTAEEVIGRSTREVLLGDYLGVSRADAREILYGTGHWEGEVFNVRKDGTRINVLVTASVLRSETGAVTGMVAINRDITAQKTTEAAIQKSERKFRSLIENSVDAIVLLDNDGHIIHFRSSAATRILGYRIDETAGRSVFDIIHLDDQRQAANVLQRILKDATAVVTIELRLWHKDGSVRWVEAVASNLLADPAVEAIVVNYRDITQRKEAEARLQYQVMLLSHITDSVISTDENFVVRSWNASAETLFGYTAQEVMGRTTNDFLVIHYVSLDRTRVMSHLEIDGHWTGEVRVQHKLGHWVDTTASSSLIRNEFGRITGYITINHDITQRKQLERMLIRHADEMTVLHAVALAATESISEDDLIERITTIIGATLYPDNFGILMLDPAAQQLVIHTSYHGMDMTGLSRVVLLNTGITGMVATLGQPLRVDDVTQNKSYVAASPITRSELCVPIKADTHIIGVINAESTTPGAFSEADEKILITIAGQVANTIEKLRLFDALRKSESNYRALVEQLPAITYEVTLASTPDEVNLTTYISPRVESILGFSPEEWMADPELWIAQVHPEDRERVVREARAHERGDAPLSIEYRSLTRDGRVVWFNNQYAHIPAGEGEPSRLHGIMLDITERKQAEEALRDSENLFRRSIEAAGAVPYRRDHRLNRYVYMGDGIHTIIGYTSEEFTTELLETLTIENRLGSAAQGLSLDEAVARARAGQFPQWRNDLLLRTRSGGLRWVSDSSVELYDETGNSTGSIGILQDVTERRLREREMEAIATLSARLRTSNNLSEITGIVVDQVIEILRSDTATFIVHDPVSGNNRIELSRGRLAQWTGRVIEGGAGIIGHVIESGQPYTTADLHTDTIGNDQALFPPGTAIGCAPLIAQNEVLGALSVSRSTPFGESDIRILTAIADIAANAYRRAILYDETRHRADQLAAVNRLGRTLSETFDVPDIYRQVHSTIFQLIPDVAALIIESFNEREQIIRCEYAVQDGEIINAADIPVQPLEMAGMGLQSAVIHSRQPLAVNDLQGMNWRNGGRLRSGASPDITKSALLAPMLAKDAVRGVVQLQSYALNRFSHNDAELLSFIANTAAIAVENARLFAETQLRLQRMQALHRIDEAVSASLDLRLTLNVLLTQAITQLGVDATSVLLVRAHNQSLEYAAGQGFRTRAIEQTSIRIGVGITGRSALERRPTYAAKIDDLGADFLRRSLLAAESFKTYYAVPIIAKGNIKGVLEFFHRSNLEIGHEWEDFADTLARQAAIAVENIVLFDDLQRTNTELTLAYDTTLEGWSHALDLRDKETEGHTERVTELTVRLGRVMGLGEADILNLRRGALLHDIGKMGIPDSILLKQGPLTEEEWDTMRKHPDYAYQLLKPIAFLRNTLDIPYCHHERWDGSGYPRGLMSTEIPLAARIFSIVDVWDALRSNRPYRQAWPEEQVLAYIKEQSGKHFDPHVVQTFLAMTR